MDELRERFTVFVVDDDASVRDSLALLLSLQGYRTALFASAEDFLHGLNPDAAGCVIADVRMPGLSGLELQTELSNRGVRIPVIIITAHGNVAAARAAFHADAVDFLEKPFGDEQLIRAIESALERERARFTAHERRRRQQAILSVLSEREREVMNLLVRGMHNRAIGEALGISPRTVEVHKAHILKKLDIRTLADLIHVAMESQ